MKRNNSSIKQFFTKLLVSEYFILVLSVVFYLVMCLIRPKMFSVASAKNIASNMWPLLTVCLGQTFVLLLGGIDLSQTAVISFSSTVMGVLIGGKFDAIKFESSPLWEKIIHTDGGLLSGMSDVGGMVIAILAMLAVGALIGCINGIFVAKLSMPPFMITLISEMFWSALALWLVCSQNCVSVNPGFVTVANGKLGGVIPMPFVWAMLLLIFCEVLLSKTIYGRWIYSVGSNAKASVISGVPKNKIIIFVYSMSGFCAAVGSMIYSGRQQMGRPTLGDGMLNDVLGATVIGGVSMYGGKGKAIWALYGVFFYCIMTTAMNMLRLNSFVIQVVKGCIILLAVSLDIVRTSLQKQMTV